MPDEAIEQLGEVYGQELADIGQVGLESWAVDQPDTFETRKQITEEMAKGKPHFRNTASRTFNDERFWGNKNR